MKNQKKPLQFLEKNQFGHIFCSFGDTRPLSSQKSQNVNISTLYLQNGKKMAKLILSKNYNYPF